MACGFYYRWTFPRGETVEQIEAWLAARKAWRKELRLKLRERREHLDSPLLCARAAARAWGFIPPEKGLPEWKATTYPLWRDIRGSVVPETEAVRLDPYLAEDAAVWGRDNPGVIWYQHHAFGAWVAELSGFPIFGGGAPAVKRLKEEQGDRAIICSINAHGRGRDGLQFLFHNQLVANPSSSGSRWEQLLGRLHRAGQKAPQVCASFYRHTPELEEHVDSALRKALYVENTLGTAQKLRVGFLNP